MNTKINLKPYVISIIVFIALNYLIYIIFDINTTVKIIQLVGYEDGVVEYMTFFSFLGAFIVFLGTFLMKKNIFYLLLAIIFFMGAGEEISWGQRIFNFSTPETLKEVNVQKEFNIHNLDIFNTYDENAAKKGLAKLITIGFLFKLFWLSFCIILPLIYMRDNILSEFVKRISLLVSPLSIGIFFLVSWFFYKIIVKYFFVSGQPPVYYLMVGEMDESISAFVFLVLAIYFYNLEKRNIKSINT